MCVHKCGLGDLGHLAVPGSEEEGKDATRGGHESVVF
jgi:hypothetical protein